MIRLIFAVIYFLFLGTAAVWAQNADNAAADQSSGQFHPPQTAAEKTLDKVLRLSINSNGNLFHFVLKDPYYDPKKDTGYAKFFTPTLLATIAKLQADMVQKECGGKYTGEICGFDMDPVLCAQDWPAHYLYQTNSETATDAVIAYTWPGFKKQVPSASYHLIYAENRWQVDGIHCFDMNGFNMK